MWMLKRRTQQRNNSFRFHRFILFLFNFMFYHDWKSERSYVLWPSINLPLQKNQFLPGSNSLGFTFTISGIVRLIFPFPIRHLIYLQLTGKILKKNKSCTINYLCWNTIYTFFFKMRLSNIAPIIGLGANVGLGCCSKILIQVIFSILVI